MSAEEEKDVAGETPAEPKAAKEPAAKKARAKKASSKAAAKEEQAGKDGQQATLKGPAKAKRAAKKAVENKAAAPGSGGEAKEAAKAQDAAKPFKKAARGAAAVVKGKPSRRKVVHAHARYVRTSARKARMVCGHLRGKSIQEARAILAFTPREVARDWSKLLESAVANAETNHELLEDDLIVREAYADEGPTIKRFRPRAMGRATPIRKRTSHLTITLTPGPEPGTTKRRG
jgi:ribosomal protein L22